MLNSIGAVLGRYACWILIAGVAVAVIIHMMIPIAGMTARIPKDYNEGWNAFHALAVARGTPLYPDPAALAANNYPPLSFYIVAALGSLVDDNIIAGRIASLVGLLVVGLGIGLIARQLKVPRGTAVFSGLLFVGFSAAWFPAYIAMDDPQWLGHAFATIGLLIFLAGHHKLRMLGLSSLLILASGLIKHALIPVPVAITLWLAVYDRRQLLIWLVVCSTLLTAALVVLFFIFGWPLFLGVVGTPRGYSVTWDLIPKLQVWLPPLLLLLPTPFIAAFADRRPEARLIVIYAFVAAAWGVFIAGGAGVDSNALFDLIISLSLTSGLAIEALARRAAAANQWAVRCAAMLVLALPVVSTGPRIFGYTKDYLADFRNTAEACASDVEYLKSVRGPVMCEALAICYWAGKTFEVDFFNTGQKLERGTISDRSILEKIENTHFGVIELEGEGDKPMTRRLPENVVRAILSSYVLDRRSDCGGFFLRPAGAGTQ